LYLHVYKGGVSPILPPGYARVRSMHLVSHPLGRVCGRASARSQSVSQSPSSGCVESERTATRRPPQAWAAQRNPSTPAGDLTDAPNAWSASHETDALETRAVQTRAAEATTEDQKPGRLQDSAVAAEIGLGAWSTRIENSYSRPMMPASEVKGTGDGARRRLGPAGPCVADTCQMPRIPNL
jgi:hypothetical protein